MTEFQLFDGVTYSELYDGPRLRTQMARVWRAMIGGQWLTLEEIQNVTGGSTSSISARIRDFRKSKFGGHEVLRRRRGSAEAGIHEYRLVQAGRTA